MCCFTTTTSLSPPSSSLLFFRFSLFFFRAWCSIVLFLACACAWACALLESRCGVSLLFLPPFSLPSLSPSLDVRVCVCMRRCVRCIGSHRYTRCRPSAHTLHKAVICRLAAAAAAVAGAPPPPPPPCPDPLPPPTMPPHDIVLSLFFSSLSLFVLAAALRWIDGCSDRAALAACSRSPLFSFFD